MPKGQNLRVEAWIERSNQIFYLEFKKSYDHLRMKMKVFSCFDVNPAADSKSVIFN